MSAATHALHARALVLRAMAEQANPEHPEDWLALHLADALRGTSHGYLRREPPREPMPAKPKGPEAL